MDKVQFWAEPWWVNLLILIPLASFWIWRVKGLLLSLSQLLLLTTLGMAFGFIESSVVVYLRAAMGLLPGYEGTLADVRRVTPQLSPQLALLHQFPQSLLIIETWREAATLVLLVSLAVLVAPRPRERFAAFLWTFASWDIFYYVGLWATIRWPRSLKDLDVLFLIPTPWLASVWFPVLVSSLTLLSIARCALRRTGQTVE